MNHALLGQIAGIMAIIQVIPYLVSIFRGHTKPERMSYFIWVILEVVTTASYFAVGARTTIWTGIVYAFTAVIIFSLSIKYGIGGLSTFDILCFFSAMTCIALWIITKDAFLTLYFAMFVSFIAYLPTIKKAYFLPETENTLSWAMTACTAVVNVCALTTLSPSIAIRPALGVIEPTVVTYFLLFHHAHIRIARGNKPHKLHLFLSHPIFIK